MTDALVKVRGVSKTFGIYPALTDLSFDLHAGEVFGYIGPNGAGKTTTMKILAGLIPKYQGEISIAGRESRKRQADLHELVGFVPQSVGFQTWHTVESALLALGTLSGVGKDKLQSRIDELLTRFDLAADRHKKVKQLSGGMTQKLGLIQALLHDPKLLILDEPLAGLDPVSRSLVKEIVREQRAAGTCVMFSSHILSDLQDVADRVGILSAGHLVEVGSLRELKQRFGMPVDLALEFSVPPSDTNYFQEHSCITHATERRTNDWLLRLASDANADQLVHELVTSTLKAGGHIRRITAVDANLDELYATFIANQTNARHA